MVCSESRESMVIPHYAHRDPKPYRAVRRSTRSTVTRPCDKCGIGSVNGQFATGLGFRCFADID